MDIKGPITSETRVRTVLEFSEERLCAYLRGAIPGLEGEMRLEHIGGGQSNPTFFVTFDNRRMVLRKRPAGVNLLPSAHAVDREYRILNALKNTDVPVPKTVLLCEDESIVGTPFYLMERMDGRILTDCALAQVPWEQRKAMYMSMAETMARLHRVDWAAQGLSDYGKPGNYYSRQIARWTRQWEMSKTAENKDIDSLIRWLPEHIPPGDETTISHGDFRLGNLMFHPTQPHVIAVLDWELSTLGHPLADVAYNCMAWFTQRHEFSGLKGLDLEATGLPGLQEYLAHYQGISQREETITTFHLAFSMFRFAVILEGITARAKSGSAVGDDAEEVGRLCGAFARHAMKLVEKGTI